MRGWKGLVLSVYMIYIYAGRESDIRLDRGKGLTQKKQKRAEEEKKASDIR